MTDVLIIGGGIMGMLAARELAARNVNVTLVERGELGREASWAGGGIISPLYPWRYPAMVSELVSLSQHYYPQLAQDLLAETSLDIEWHACGLLMLDPKDSVPALQWASAQQQSMTALPANQLANHIPSLADNFNHGLWMPQVAHIRNSRLMKALAQRLRQQKQVRICEQTAVVAFKREGDAVQGAVTAAGDVLPAKQIVVTAGAWSGELLAKLDIALPVEPVRGQMLLFAPQPGLLPCMVLHRNHYLIPRRDGRILVGSTLERTGFDNSTTKVAYEQLYQAAIEMLPALQSAKVEAHWAGLRPGSPEGIPFIGRATGMQNLWLCTGHFRNGLVLAPASVQRLVEGVLETVSPEVVL